MNKVVLTLFREDAIPYLQQFRDTLSITGDAANLIEILTDEGRARGQNVVIGWEDGIPTGCAGWATFNLESNGELMGAPVQAATPRVAAALVKDLIGRAHALAAQYLVIGAAPGEDIKEAVLLENGFDLNTERCHYSCATQLGNISFASFGLRHVQRSALDGEKLSRIYLEVFPHWSDEPGSQPDTITGDWAFFDWNASTVLADKYGNYAAFLTVSPGGQICDIGVSVAWRGKGIARQLYRYASTALAKQGIANMTAEIAAFDTDSIHFHQRMGLREDRPRYRVYVLALKPVRH